MFFNFNNHFFDHFLHFIYFRWNLDDFVLHISMLQDTFTAKHLLVIFTEELYLFAWMNITELNGVWRSCIWVNFSCAIFLIGLPHWKCCQNLIVNRQILWLIVMSNFIIRTFYNLMFVHLFDTLKTKWVTTW